MKRKLSRREFIKKSAVSLAAISIPNIALPGVSAAAGNPKAFVVAQLTGGLDPFLAFPYTADVSALRSPNAKIAPSGLTEISPGMAVHPGLSQLSQYFSTLKVIMQTGNAFLNAPDRSHEIAQIYMATGGYGDINKRVGWTARLFDKGIDLRGFNGLSPSFNCETCQMPPIVTSTYEDLNIGDTPLYIEGHTAESHAKNSKHIEKVIEQLSGYRTKTGSDAPNSDPIGLTPSRNMSEVEKYYRKSQRNMFHALDRIAGRNGIVGTLSPAYRTPYYNAYETVPANIPQAFAPTYKQLGVQFRNIAQTLKEMKAKGDGSSIIFVLQFDGFDIHDNWLTRGNTLMWSLGSTLKIFLDDLVNQNLYNDTAVFFCTEFGRTILSNDTGTDHGIGYTSFVLGGKVNGGVYGKKYNVQELAQIARTNGNAWPREISQERIIADIIQNHLKADPKIAFPGEFLDKVPAAPGLNLFRA